MMKKACRNCIHFRIDGEGWELPQFNYPACEAVPGAANLTTFPFKNTNCLRFVRKDSNDR